MKLIRKVEETNLIEYGDKIVVGVSGGPDSVCLLDVLLKLRDKYNLTIFVVHINHCIREESIFEEEYVKKICNKFNVAFFSKKIDVKEQAVIQKKSVEEVARNIRYAEFNNVLKEVKANKIAVAHNANDNVETVLMNLTRGAGITGLCGIKKKNGNIIRPLLGITREEILKYIEENEITVFYDRTNFENDYTRNKIRNIIVPEFIKINPGFVENVGRSTNILEGQKDILDEFIKEKYREVSLEKGLLNKKRFLEFQREVQLEILRLAINDFYGNLTDIGFKNLNNALDIIKEAQSGRIIEIFPQLKIEICYDILKFFEEKEKLEFCYEVKINGETYIPELNKTIVTHIVKSDEVPNKYEDKNKCFFDIEKLGEKVYVRNKREGDFFFPSGMLGKKTLKKFFSDLKIDVNERERIPLIVSGDEIVWVAGYRTSGKFLKDKKTKEVIIFEYGENI